MRVFRKYLDVLNGTKYLFYENSLKKSAWFDCKCFKT